MEIMNLIGGSRRPPKQSQSYVGEDALLGRTRGPIFAAHYPIVGRGAAESNAIALVVRADPSECTAAGHEPFKVENMRRLQIRSGGLIVAAVFIQPRNGVRIGA